MFPQLLYSLLTHKQLFFILLPSTLFSFLTLSNCSASLFPQLFSLQTLSNCSASLFHQLFFSLSNSRQLLSIFFHSTLLHSPFSKQEKKSWGNKDAEQLLRVRKTRIVEGTRTQSIWLELEEKRRRVEETRMQSSCSELEERRRGEETSI